VFALLPAALFLMLLFLMAQLHSFGPRGAGGGDRTARIDRHRSRASLLANRPLGFVAILGKSLALRSA